MTSSAQNIPDPIILAHVADTHVDAEEFPQALSARGGNQRGEDMTVAFANVVKDIRSQSDIPLLLHAGDVADTPHPDIKYLISLSKIIASGSGPLSVGSPYTRQSVYISGNHDVPRNPLEPCYLALYSDIPGVHIVVSGYQVISFEEGVANGTVHPSLAKVAVHCLPHDDLKTQDWDEIQPWDGYINIFMSHGVAEGSALFVRSKGREYHIPNDVLDRDWDYVALGHYHKQGPVFLSTNTKGTNSRIWYSGSTERCGFSDFTDEADGKGYLRTIVSKDAMPQVERIDLPIRPMYYLPSIDASDMTADQVSEVLLKNVQDSVAAGKLKDAVVRQKIFNADRTTYSLVNVTAPRNAASSALDYSIKPSFRDVNAEEFISPEDKTGPAVNPAQDKQAELQGLAKKLLEEHLVDPSVSRALSYLDIEIEQEAPEPEAVTEDTNTTDNEKTQEATD